VKNLKRWGSIFVEPFTHSISALCSEKAIKPLKNVIIGQLDHNLRRFYAEGRTQKGELYSKSTLLGFKHGIERYLNSSPYSKELQLASDPRFLRSNQMLDAQLINLKRSGKEDVTHKPAIKEEHLQQLKASVVFSLSSPISLLRNIWFHIVLFFCRRGREGQRAQPPKASTMCSLFQFFGKLIQI